jgi:hypothetical protein
MSGKFFSALRELRTGATLDELDSALAEVVSAVKTIGKPGAITLTLKILPGRGATYLVITDDVTVKVPKVDRADTIFFPLADNTLTRTDPNQLALGLKMVPSDKTLRVDPETGEILSA